MSFLYRVKARWADLPEIGGVTETHGKVSWVKIERTVKMKEHQDHYLVVQHGEVMGITVRFDRALRKAQKIAKQTGNPVTIDAIEQLSVSIVYPTHVHGRES